MVNNSLNPKINHHKSQEIRYSPRENQKHQEAQKFVASYCIATLKAISLATTASAGFGYFTAKTACRLGATSISGSSGALFFGSLTLVNGIGLSCLFPILGMTVLVRLGGKKGPAGLFKAMSLLRPQYSIPLAAAGIWSMSRSIPLALSLSGLSIKHASLLCSTGLGLSVIVIPTAAMMAIGALAYREFTR